MFSQHLYLSEEIAGVSLCDEVDNETNEPTYKEKIVVWLYE